MLLQEVIVRIPNQRLAELSNAVNGGGLKTVPLTGTVTVTAGSTAVAGAGTAFVTGGLQGMVTTYGAIAVQFASQPGVSYPVVAVTSDTALTLGIPYSQLTAAGTTAVLPGINYAVLQGAVFDAQMHFQTVTDLVYDNVTQNANQPGANPILNKCIWAAVALVVAYLYEPGRGNPWPEAEVESAWRIANKRLDYVLHNYGDGAWSAPYTDSVFQPSTGPFRLPNTDNQRWSDISPMDPGPGPSDVPGGGGGSAESWNW